MSVSFTNASPDFMDLFTPRSTTQAVKRKQMIEFPAEGVSSFNFSGAKEIRFNISSNSEIMRGAESYFSGDFTFTKSKNALGVADTLRLEMGGVHSLFSKIEVRSNATSTTLQTYELYNKYYVLKTRFGDVNTRTEGFSDGDGHEQESTFVQTLTQAAGVPVTQLRTESNEQPLYPIASQVSVIQQQVVFPNMNDKLASAAAGATNSVACQWKLRMTPFLSLLRQDIPLMLLKGGIQIVFTIACPTDCFYLNGRYGGIATSTTQLASVLLGMQIDNPKYICSMVLPSDEYTAQLVNKYRSPSGLFLNIPSYRCLRNSVISTAQSQSVIMNPGIRSLRRTYGAYYSTKYQLNNVTGPSSDVAYAYQNHAHAPVGYAFQSYNWKVGSTDFPPRLVYLLQSNSSYTATDLDAAVGVQYQIQSATLALFKIAALYTNILNWVWVSYIREPLTLRQAQYDAAVTVSGGFAGQVYTAGTAAASTDLRPIPFYPGIFVQDFSRDSGNDGFLTGVDCSVYPLEFRGQLVNVTMQPTNAQISAGMQALWADGGLEFIVFAEHDNFLQISKDAIVVLN